MKRDVISDLVRVRVRVRVRARFRVRVRVRVRVALGHLERVGADLLEVEQEDELLAWCGLRLGGWGRGWGHGLGLGSRVSRNRSYLHLQLGKRK